MRALAALRWDVRLQFRHGFYAAYAFVCVVYIALLHALPHAARAVVLPAVLLSEAAVIGFLFAGTLLHLERSDGTLQALAVTPLTAADYLAARAVSLGLLTAAVAVAVAYGGLGAAVHGPLVALASALTAGMFVCGGVATATRIPALDRFAVVGGLGTSLFGLPVLPHFGVLESPLWYVLPTAPVVSLFAAAVGGGAPTLRVLADVLLALLWAAAAWTVSVRWVDRYGFGRRRAA